MISKRNYEWVTKVAPRGSVAQSRPVLSWAKPPTWLTERGLPYRVAWQEMFDGWT